jgi:hypothetical protein
LKKTQGLSPEELPPGPQPKKEKKEKGERPNPEKNLDPAEPPKPPKDNSPVPGRPHPSGKMAEQALPDIVKKHFEEKRGYANYFFNRQEQERLWKAWNSRSRLEKQNGPWLISGESSGGGNYQFTLSDDGISLKLPSSELKWTPGDELNAALMPSGSGGMFPALYLWRRLAVEGFPRFGDVYYLGSAPLVNHNGLADVIVGSHKGVECRFYFDSLEGRLLALEMFPDIESDPCEIDFSQYHDLGGRDLPGRIEVRYGDETFGVFSIHDFRVEKNEKADEKKGGAGL